MTARQRHDGRLSIHSYVEVIERVESQFALVRFALKALSKAKIRGFYTAHLSNQSAAVQAGFEKLKEFAPDEDFENVKDMALEHLAKKHRKQNRPADVRFKIEFSEDRLNQSELLLLVAHFESFMKEIHRAFLTAAPGKVFSKRDTKVMLRDVFEDQAGSPFSKFLSELIIKEVKFLDSQRIGKRAEYFAEHYGISFGSEKDIEDLKEIMEVRNKISHEIYAPALDSLEQVKDQALVGDEMLKRARELLRNIPSRCIQAGAKVYQSYFR